MYKTQNKTEKICRWLLYSIMLMLTLYVSYLRWFVYPELTKPEFGMKIWGDGKWVYLIGIVLVTVFLYVRSNLTAFKNLIKDTK